MDIFKPLLLFALVVLFSSTILGQIEKVFKTDTIGVYKLSDVVVSATKTDNSTLKLASSISIIDSTEIANRKKLNVFDLIKFEYGLNSLQFGPLGGLSTISIRGANAGQSLVLLDGVEMNMPSESSNLFDFANVPIEGVSKIEVLRGPQSTLYGSDAMAGVINIISQKGFGKPTVNIFAEAGSYNSFRGSAALTGSSNNFNYMISLARTQSDGFSAASEKLGNSERDGYKGNNIASRFGYELSETADINLIVRYTDAKTDLDQFGGKNGDDLTYIYILREFVSRAEGYFSLLDGDWEQKIGASFYSNSRKYNFDSTFTLPDYSNSNYDGKRYKIDWQNNFHLPANNIVTFGAETRIDEIKTEYFYNSSFGPFESIIPKSTVYIHGVFLQDQITVNNSFFVTCGIRYDHHSEFKGAFTYKIAPGYVFWQTGTKLKATVGTGFKAPSLVYLYDPDFGNINLKPEESFGWDAGIEQFFWDSGISVGVTYFSNEFTNLIGLDENFRAINIDKAQTNGIEIFTTVNPVDNASIKANYTYLESKDLSDTSPDKGLPLLRRPTHKAGLIVDYSFLQRANVNLEIIYVGEKDGKDFSTFPAERIIIDSYSLVNFAAHYDVLVFLRIFARVENLFDVEYEEVFGYGTPGLSGFAGIKLTL
ncbi:MAG: TonB-dependent receptor [Ignavibacterium sp.]|nr:MAG: TonB-dependent receptor [Ignavibacterium sp.]